MPLESKLLNDLVERQCDDMESELRRRRAEGSEPLFRELLRLNLEQFVMRLREVNRATAMPTASIDDKGKARGPLLDRLSDDGERVLTVTRGETPGTFRVAEACDDWFAEQLTEDELRALGLELIEVAGQ